MENKYQSFFFSQKTCHSRTNAGGGSYHTTSHFFLYPSIPQLAVQLNQPAGACKKRVRGRAAAQAEVAQPRYASCKRLKPAVPGAREPSWDRAVAEHVSPPPMTRRQEKLRARLETLRVRLAAMDDTTMKPADRKKTKNKRSRTRKSMAKQRRVMIDAECWLTADQEAYVSQLG